MRLDYRPGAQFLVARPGLTFLAPDLRLARRVWAAIGTTGQVDDLLVELVRDGLRATGAFVLVDASDGQVRVLVRGDVPVRVRSETGTVAWAGAGVSTWAEQVFDRVDAVVVGVGDQDAGDQDLVDQDADRLPLRDGIVGCAGFVLDGTGRPRADFRPAAAVAGPPPVPASASASARREAPQPVGPPPWGTEPVAEPEPTQPEPSAVPVPSAVPEPRDEVVPRDPAQTRTESPDDGFDHLFESTIVRSVEDAAIRDTPDDAGVTGSFDASGAEAAGADASGAEAGGARLGDHDGDTIAADRLGAVRHELPDADPVDATPTPEARLELSTGDVVALDRDVVIGRRPEVDRVQGGQVPTVLTVPSPRQDVSRTHLRIGWSGRTVLATDLHSMNGTVLIGADGTARALDGGVPQALAEGDTLDVGDGITLTLRLTSA